MRRSDRERTDREWIAATLRDARVCHLGLVDAGAPYVVPVSFGYDGRHVYIHSAPEGRKLRALQREPRVCVQFEVDCQPVRAARACAWGMRFRSVVGFGTAAFVTDPAQKRHGLQTIMAQYAGPGHEFTFADDEVARTTVIRVHLEQLTGKQVE